MARIQVLELPMEHYDTATVSDPPTRTPFALIIDEVSQEQADRLNNGSGIEAFGKGCGALAVGVFPLTIDLA